MLLTTVLALFLLGAAPASGTIFNGKTSQGRAASVTTDDATGFVQLVKIRWRAGCANGGRLLESTDFRPPFDLGRRLRVRDSGPTYTIPDPAGVRISINVSLNAVRSKQRLWRGNFRATAIVRRRGAFITRCRVGPIRWSATSR